MNLGKLPRKLTPELQEIIDRRSRTPVYAWISPVFSLAFGLFMGGFFWHMTTRFGFSLWLVDIIYALLVLGSLASGIWGLYHLVATSRRERTFTTELLRHGKKAKARVSNITESWNITVNKWPLRKIEMRVAGENVELTTFDPAIVEEAKEKKTLNVLIHPETKKVVPIITLKPKKGLPFQKVE